MALELFQFQATAAAQIADRYTEYASEPLEVGRKSSKREVPFYQALSSITGSGKTAILAQAVNEIVAASPVPPVILWLSKGKVVVQQSYANLADGGKYNHLLADASVRLLSEYRAVDVEHATEALLYFATVGTFNQKDRQASNLKIFQTDTDITETTLWEALKERATAEGERRPLIVVYDEAQNLSDQQTDLLLEQQPAGFLLASATLKFPERFNREVIEPLKTVGEYADADLITSISSAAVVASGLVKSTISLEGLNAPMEETISEMLSAMDEAVEDAATEGVSFSPKAIYVCNTNMVADDAGRSDDPKQEFNQRLAPPIVIWRYLTEVAGIRAEDIAVYADLKTNKEYPLPSDFNLFSGGESDYATFTEGDYQHIIFNLALQEGWDDPAAYFAYVDKSMESPIQITQIVGRVLRQPDATHYSAERLNTAHFYVRVDRNNVFNDVVEDVRKGLGGDAPEVRILTTAPGQERPVRLPVKTARTVSRTGIDNAPAKDAVEDVLAKLNDYSADLVNTKGVGRKRVVQQTIGNKAVQDSEWEDFEQSNQLSARWVFRREVSRRYRPALTVINSEGAKFDARVGFGSPAYKHVVDLAEEAVDEYLGNAVVKQIKPNPYAVGSILARPSSLERFDNALHEGYDGLNSLELPFARALDASGLPWCRNPAQTGYKIPLISLGSTVWFFPDFLVWVGDTVLCIDTKGEHLVQTDAGRKLLSVVPNPRADSKLDVTLVSKGKWNQDGSPSGPDGFSIWSLRNDQKLKTKHYEDLTALVVAFASVGAVEADLD